MPTARAPALPRPPSDAARSRQRPPKPAHPRTRGRSNRIVTGGSWYPMWRCRKRGWHGCTCAAKADIWSENGLWFRHGAARGDNWQSIRNRTYRALRPPAAETRVQRPRRGVDETGFPVRRRRAGTAAGRTCRQRRSAGLHENRERFLGCTAGIAIFARLGQRPPRRHTGLGTAPPGYGNGNGL